MSKGRKGWLWGGCCLLSLLLVLVLGGWSSWGKWKEWEQCVCALEQGEKIPGETVFAAGEIGLELLESVGQRPEEHEISGFPVIYQQPQLPTGCEVTALTMALQYAGYPVDKVTMATQYLPTAPADTYYGQDGRLYGSDMERYFVGDPTTELGYICGTSAILAAADAYLADQGSSLRGVDRTGASPEELYEPVSRDIPVVVWVTIGMQDRRPTQGWYTPSGEYQEWSTNDHGAVLIGYTPQTVLLADPIAGRVEYSREQFERVFASRGSRCVILA